MGIGVLGPLTVDGSGGAVAPRDRAVLTALVVSRGTVVTTDALAEAVWGDAPPASATKVVQGCVARLRRRLGPEAIETLAGGYRLALAADDLDAARFEHAVERSRELLAVGDADRAAVAIDEALALWRGSALSDARSWLPAELEATRLEQLRLDAEELRIEALLHAGRSCDVLADGEAAVAAAPLRERRWCLLARALYQAGRQAEALATVRRARRSLSAELGLDPGPELAALEAAILRQDPSLAGTGPARDPSTSSPYAGLSPYDVDDADAFFGRDREVAECLRRLASDGVLVVVGSSGSGKSSLVRAGVGAALQRQGREVVVVTPGSQPTAALPTSRRGGHQAVLVVDQCEEAVTLCNDRTEQARFFAALAGHAAEGPLIVALRADRLGEVTVHRGFARVVERGLFLLGRLDDDGLRAAIEGPAGRAGLLLEPGLVELLLRDVEGEPGALPLLSHALRETWERREGRVLTVAGYRASGGVRGAVTRSAEEIYEQAPPEQRVLLRGLLLRLVSPSPEGEPVRNRIPRDQVALDSAHERLIERLVRARLVTSDEDTVELAHEALTRAWPRLRGWLDDDVEGQHIRRHLTAAAASWDAMGRPDSELYRGVRLLRVLAWRDETEPDLNATEVAFLAAAQRRDAAERYADRRRRSLLTRAAAVVVLVTVGLAAVAVTGQQRAVRAADVARARELTAAAVAALDTDPSLAKLLALAAAELSPPTVDTLRILHRAIADDRVVARYRWPAEHQVQRLATDLHPDGTRLVASGSYAGPSTHLEVYDLERGEVVWAWDVDDPAVVIDRPVFAPDGRSVVAGLLWEPQDGRQDPPVDQLGAVVWAADTGEILDAIDLGSCGGLVLGVTATHVLAQTRPAGDAPGCWADPSGSPLALELIDAATGERTVVSERSWGREGALSGDGRRVAVTEDTAAGPRTAVVEVATGDRLLEFDPFATAGHGVGVVRALNHDGTLLAAGYQPIVVWDVALGDAVSVFRGHAGDAYARFGPDGASVHSAGVDGTLRHWDARTGEVQAVFRAVGAGVWLSTADGRALVPDPATGTAAVIDTGPRSEVWGLPTCDGSTWAQTLGVAGRRAAVSVDCTGDEHRTFVVDLDDRQLVYDLPGHRAQDLALSPDGTRFVRQEGGDLDGTPVEGSWFGPPQIRELTTGQPLVRFADVCSWDVADPEGREPGDQPGCGGSPPGWLYTWTLAWSPDATRVVAGGEALGVAVWDAASGELLARPDVCSTFAQSLLFAPGGDELYAFCTTEGRLVALSTDSWEEVRSAELAPDVEMRGSMALAGTTPDGRWLVGVGGAMFHGGVGLLHWIDPATLEIDHTLPRIHEGTPKSWAMSPDGNHLATGASDGSVKVWDVTARTLVHELHVGDTQVQGLAFVDDRHLAVAPEEGGLHVHTLDPDELVRLARASLARGPTPTECERFALDPCPSLADLREGGADGE